MLHAINAKPSVLKFRKWHPKDPNAFLNHQKVSSFEFLKANCKNHVEEL